MGEPVTLVVDEAIEPGGLAPHPDWPWEPTDTNAPQLDSIGRPMATTAAQDAHIALVNAFRGKHGLPPLAVSPILSRAAESKARAMADVGVMAHTLNGVTAKQNAINHGYPLGSYGGENILWGQATAAQAFGAWANSPDHRDNMLSPHHKAIGVGGPATSSTKIRNAWAQVFGRHVDGPAPEPTPPPKGQVTGLTPWRAIGDAHLAVWRAEFERRGSPLLPTVGECWAAARPHSALALAMMAKESEYGTTGEGRAAKNPMNISCGWSNGGHIWCRYETHAACLADWAKRLTDPNGPYAATASLESLVHVYAPNSDGNNEAEYVAQTAERINRYLAGGGSVPTIYDLANDADAARFGLTPARRDELLTQRINFRGGLKPRAILWHIQDGHTPGSLAWWLDGPNVQASATVMIQRNGSILRVIPEVHGPWTNGDVSAPTAWGKKVADWGGGDPNKVTLSIEAEGKPWDEMPQAQADAILWQTRDWMARYSIPAADVGPHAALNSVSRPNCPGAYFKRLHPLLGDGPTPETRVSKVVLPAGVVHTDLPVWFGEQHFDPNGSVSTLWAQEGARTGRFPALESFDIVGKPRRFRFADGLIIVSDADGVRIARKEQP